MYATCILHIAGPNVAVLFKAKPVESPNEASLLPTKGEATVTAMFTPNS